MSVILTNQFVLLAIIAFLQSTAANVQVCEENMLFYDDLLCMPVYKNPDNPCPHHFNCSIFESWDKEKCYFRGQILNIGEELKSPITEAQCYTSCMCTQTKDGPEIQCEAIRCPEKNVQAKEGCEYKYHIDKCCAIGEICPNEQDVVYCHMNGKKYLEGSRYKSVATHEVCVCVKDEKGKPINQCRKISCLLGIIYKKEIENYCAPVFTSTEDSCPVSMHCPNKVDTPQGKNCRIRKDTKCQFGKNFWNVGDILMHVSPLNNLACSCTIPPFVTCIEETALTVKKLC